MAAYLLGSIPVAYLVAKWTRGIDLRKHGSGNVGSSNVLAVTSKRWAFPVMVFDTGKGLLAVLAARAFGLGIEAQLVVGLAAVAGHNWPIFLGFRGGRGILTTLGVILAFSPLLGTLRGGHLVCLRPGQATVAGCVYWPVSPAGAGLLSPRISRHRRTGAGGRRPGRLTALAYVRRLMAGRRSELAADLSTGELLLNRLLFDRDIRDRKMWLSRSENTGKAFS